MARLSKRELKALGTRGTPEHETVSRIMGVTPGDSPIAAALKGYRVAVTVWGKDHPQVKKMRRMIEAAGGKVDE